MIQIENMERRHWEAVEQIYLEGIATGQATFQTGSLGWQEWDSSHTASCRLVAVQDAIVLGWAALSPVSDRCAYAGVAEVSIYVAEIARGKGIGKNLLEALIAKSEENDYWTLQAGIFPENIASIQLHQQAGFRIIGNRERIGKLQGVWRDTVMLERRSTLNGID